MTELKIEYIPIDSITPYERNARRHEEADINAIAASIKEFGFDDPIGVWGDNNIIVEGHGRLLAARQLGISEVPCIRLDHLTEEQRRAYALAHNKTAENSEWDFSLLPDELANIFEIDMSAFGFIVDAEPLFDYMDDFGGGVSEEGDSFDVTLNFDIELKAQFDQYIKTFGKSELKKACEEVVKNA